MLNGALTAFQSLQHPLLKRRQLGSGLVHRSPRTLFRGIHEPLCLVLRFKSHGRLTVLHQKLHTQLDDVRKSILSSRPEPEKLPENPCEQSGVAPLGQISRHEKAVEPPEPIETSGAAVTQQSLAIAAKLKINEQDVKHDEGQMLNSKQVEKYDPHSEKVREHGVNTIHSKQVQRVKQDSQIHNPSTTECQGVSPREEISRCISTRRNLTQACPSMVAF